MFLTRALGPGLERLKAKVLSSQRRRIIGHHFFITASSSVTNIGILHSRGDGMTVFIDAHAISSPAKQTTSLETFQL
jgi:hypothetical protein